jgi:hypothetical protein
MTDDYLWDRSGPPDPEVQRLERLLARYRHDAPLHMVQPRSALRRAMRIAPAAAAIVVALCGASLALLPVIGQPGNEWKVTARTGQPLVDGAASSALRIGQVLRTDAGSSAEIRAGAVARIEVEPNSVVRLVHSAGNRHRLALERGRIHARLWSPPFTFSFATPSATAFDVGCAFMLEVDERGEDVLHVTSGWVQLQDGDRQELIPAGASAYALPGHGPGTAFFDDVSAEFRSALRAVDFGPADHAAALRTLLRLARKRDVYTLLRLALHVPREDRGAIYDRAIVLAPPPADMTREAFIEHELDVTDEWVRSLGLGEAKRWWVNWKDVLPL